MSTTRRQLPGTFARLPIPDGRYPQVDETLRHALARCQALGCADAGLVISMLNLGIAYHVDGCGGVAARWYTCAMQIVAALEQSRLPFADIARSLETVYSLYLRDGDFPMAEAVLNRIVSITRAALGGTHPQVVALQRRHEWIAGRLARSTGPAVPRGRIPCNRGFPCDGIY